MTLITDILARAARQCSVPAPSSWITATTQDALEIRDFLDETVDDILERVDVTQPVSKQVTLTGDGNEFLALPSDFKRLHRGDLAVYERDRSRRRCIPVNTDGEWEYMKELGASGSIRYFRVRGYPGAYTMGFFRELETGSDVIVSYVSDKWIINGSTEKATFSDGSDESMFPRRLLESGIVWRFRERKGLEFEDKQAEYEALLARMINDTRTVRQVVFGGVERLGPYDIPVPDFIPPA